MRPCLVSLVLTLAFATSCKRQEAAEKRESGRPSRGAAAAKAPADAGAPRPDLARVCEGLPDKKIDHGTSKGTFAGIQTGGETRVLVRNEAGRLEAYHVPSPPMGYFLIAHRKAPLTLTFERLDSCYAPAGGYLRISRLTSVAAGGRSYDQWWRDQEKDPAQAEAAKQAFQRYADGPSSP
jgi:hypothetical protein